MPEATCIIHSKVVVGRWIVERVVWSLPEPTAERPHGFKYRLFCGDETRCLVRYDNEAGKGDHRHYGDDEKPYEFNTLEALLEDFQADATRLMQAQE